MFYYLVKRFCDMKENVYERKVYQFSGVGFYCICGSLIENFEVFFIKFVDLRFLYNCVDSKSIFIFIVVVLLVYRY